jgi:DnaJ-class molecular chaperone
MLRKVKVKDQVKEVEMKCKDCDGSGHAGRHKCPVCNGEKIVLKPRDLHFEVEKGMRAGDKVQFKGESEQGFEFYPGDVYLTLHQGPHALFKRQKNDLLVNLDISLKDAILGFDRKLKHLDGHDV